MAPGAAPEPASAPWLLLPAPNVFAAAAVVVLLFGVFAGSLTRPTDAAPVAARAPIVVAERPAPEPSGAAGGAGAGDARPATAKPPTATAPATNAPAAPDAASGSANAAPDLGADTATTGGGLSESTTTTGGGLSDNGATTGGDSQGTTTTGGGDTTTTTPGGGDGSAGPTGADKPPLKHVWVVMLADHGPNDLLGAAAQAPYVKSLRSRALRLSRYRAVGPGGLANLLALVSGQRGTPEQQAGCPTYTDVTAGHGCVFPSTVDSLPAQLAADGRPWKAYVEDADNAAAAGDTCRHPAIGGADPFAAPRPGDAYLTARNPFVYLHAIIDTPACATQIAGLAPLASDAQDAKTAPAVSFVIPNACHDGRDTPCAPGAPAGAAAADAWLRSALEPVLQSKAFADGGLVVVTADQQARRPDGGAPGALLLSPSVKPGALVATPYDHYDLLRTIEDAFGLSPLGAARAKKARPMGADVFSFTGLSPSGNTSVTGG